MTGDPRPLTDVGARAVAAGWVMLRDYEQRLAAFRAGGGGAFPMMPQPPPGKAEFERLFAWVRGRMDDAPEQDQSDSLSRKQFLACIVGHHAGLFENTGQRTYEQVMATVCALCEQAGWPS